MTLYNYNPSTVVERRLWAKRCVCFHVFYYLSFTQNIDQFLFFDSKLQSHTKLFPSNILHKLMTILRTSINRVHGSLNVLFFHRSNRVDKLCEESLYRLFISFYCFCFVVLDQDFNLEVYTKEGNSVTFIIFCFDVEKMIRYKLPLELVLSSGRRT